MTLSTPHSPEPEQSNAAGMKRLHVGPRLHRSLVRENSLRCPTLLPAPHTPPADSDKGVRGGGPALRRDADRALDRLGGLPLTLAQRSRRAARPRAQVRTGAGITGAARCVRGLARRRIERNPGRRHQIEEDTVARGIESTRQRTKQYLDGKEMAYALSRPKFLFLLAAGLSFLMSVFLFFSGDQMRGIYVGIWVPSILAAGALLLMRTDA
jgi:hypothetical protein